MNSRRTNHLFARPAPTAQLGSLPFCSCFSGLRPLNGLTRTTLGRVAATNPRQACLSPCSRFHQVRLASCVLNVVTTSRACCAVGAFRSPGPLSRCAANGGRVAAESVVLICDLPLARFVLDCHSISFLPLAGSLPYAEDHLPAARGRRRAHVVRISRAVLLPDSTAPIWDFRLRLRCRSRHNPNSLTLSSSRPLTRLEVFHLFA